MVVHPNEVSFFYNKIKIGELSRIGDDTYFIIWSRFRMHESTHIIDGYLHFSLDAKLWYRIPSLCTLHVHYTYTITFN